MSLSGKTGSIALAGGAALAGVLGLVATTYPEPLLALALGLFWGSVLLLGARRFGRSVLADDWLRRVVVLGLLVRPVIAVAHLAVGYLVFGQAVDFIEYFHTAAQFAQKLLEGDPDFIPATEQVGIHTLGMATLHRLGALAYLLFGPSMLSMLLYSAVLGFFGSCFFLRAFQLAFPGVPEVRFLALCLFFFPSLVFWSSLLGKDSWMYFTLGWATYSTVRLIHGVRLPDVLGLATSLVLAVLLRPPIGAVLVGAVGIAFARGLQERLWVRGGEAYLRPVGYVFSVAVLGGMLLVGVGPLRDYVANPKEERGLVEGVLEAAVQRHVGLSTDETTSLGSSLGVQIEEATVARSLQFLPGAMLTFLFRPLIFEAHNMVALVAAIDATGLIALVLWRWRHALAALRALGRPFPAYCAALVLLLTAGMAFESNFGVIVRHRSSMVLPFVLLLLATPLRRRRPGAASPPATGEVAPPAAGESTTGPGAARPEAP